MTRMVSLERAWLTGIAAIAIVSPAAAQTQAFKVPAGDLIAALDAFATQAGVQLIYRSSELRGAKSAGARGSMSADDALRRILAGTGFRSKRDASGAIAIVLEAAPNLPVQVTPQGSGSEAEAEIVVTGTLIAGEKPVGSPVRSIGRAEMERSGVITTRDILALIPQNSAIGINQENRNGVQGSQFNPAGGASVNLRGIGNAATLTLLDGQRVGGTFDGRSVDISQFPSAAIERVEVVTDGASAIYGTDAIAGVVNFITRRRLDGISVRGHVGLYDDAMAYGASIAFGQDWGSGGLFVAGQYEEQTELRAADRPFYRSDLRPIGGPDLREARGNPGNIIVGSTTYAIPENQNGVGLAPGRLIPGTANRYEGTLGIDITPHRKSRSLFAHVDQELGPDIRVFAKGLFTRSDALQRLASRSTVLTVPRSNPFFVSPVAGAPTVLVGYNVREDFGNPTADARETSYFGVAGLDWRLGDRFDLRLTQSFSQEDTDVEQHNLVIAPFLTAALADANPLTAFNPFGDGSFTNPATLARIGAGQLFVHARYRAYVSEAALSGELFDLPAGPVKVAVGATYRRETDDGYNRSNTVTGVFEDRGIIDIDRDVTAFYGEARVPVLDKAATGGPIEALTVSAALRHEKYSDFGTTTNPRFGVELTPVAGIVFRGTYGRSFRAPPLNLIDSNTIYSSATIADPRAAGGRSNVVYFSGSNPGLQPERARTWNIGVTVEPPSVPDLRLSADLFDIVYRGRISAVVLASALVNEAQFGDFIVRSPSATAVNAIYAQPTFVGARFLPATVAAIVDARWQNLGKTHNRGIDLSASYRRDIGPGAIGLSANAAYMIDAESAASEAVPLVDFVNTTDNPLRWRGRAMLDWAGHNGFDASLSANYANAYTNRLVIPEARVRSHTTFDLHLGLRLPPGPDAEQSPLRLALNVQNLFDKAPPFMVNTFPPGYGYDPQNASAFGRYIDISVSFKW